jgi:hypothetical protein
MWTAFQPSLLREWRELDLRAAEPASLLRGPVVVLSLKVTVRDDEELWWWCGILFACVKVGLDVSDVLRGYMDSGPEEEL